MNEHVIEAYVTEMRIRQYSPVTIRARLRLLAHLAAFLGDTPLLSATDDDLRGFQATFASLRPASVDIYSRHMKALYDWAARRRHITVNPADDLAIPRPPKGLPHPTKPDELRIIFACTPLGPLRISYVLAAFAGLRRGEIIRLHRRDLDLDRESYALVHGKGGKERTVPLIGPVVDELHAHGLTRGWIITKDGRPYKPDTLSAESSRHLHHELGLETTLHSMRHAYGTNVARATRDPLLVRDLLGHGSVSTTEIYMESHLQGVHGRMQEVTDQASSLLHDRRRHIRSA